MNDDNPARPIAFLILIITGIASGCAATASASGNTDYGLALCGGGLVLNVLVLLFGAYVVARNQALYNEEEGGEE